MPDAEIVLNYTKLWRGHHDGDCGYSCMLKVQGYDWQENGVHKLFCDDETCADCDTYKQHLWLLKKDLGASKGIYLLPTLSPGIQTLIVHQTSHGPVTLTSTSSMK